MPTLNRPLTATSIDDRMIAAMRLMLASSALLIIYIDPSEPDRYVTLTYTALLLYTAYSAGLYTFLLRRRSSPPIVIAHWVDVGCYVVLISLSSGTNSIFFLFFFFAILVASFRWGFASGLRVLIVSAALFTIVGFVTAPPEPAFELNQFLRRPIYFLVLGYMMASWGGAEVALKRRLALLKDVTALSNPRFGVDRTIGLIMGQLLAFYDANACLLVESDPSTARHQLRRANRGELEGVVHTQPIPEEMACTLLALPAEHALLYRREPFGWGWWPHASHQAYDVVKGEHVTASRRQGEALATALDAESFITVPVCHRGATVGRLFLITRRGHPFGTSDVDFLLQVLEHTMPTIDNIRLVDQLASDAAEAERQRIARDLHDSVIQPYIGLQMGLIALREALASGSNHVKDTVEQLIELTGAEIADLRSYTGGLKKGGEHDSGLLAAVQRFAGKFAGATGITVHVKAETDICVNDRLAAEAFQMVSEGLSNVRRHTSSGEASIDLACIGDHLILRIENESAEGLASTPFTPRSITGRAAALGGRVHVERRENGRTVVVVEIPL